MALSAYLEDALLNAVLRGVTYTSPATVYLSLHTADPTEAGSNEVVAASYARQAIVFDAAEKGSTRNSFRVTYPTATESWGVVTHVGLWDAVSGGNFLFHGTAPWSDATAVATVDIGDTLELHAGGLLVSLYPTDAQALGLWTNNGPTQNLPRLNGRLEIPVANALLDAVLRNTPYTSPTNVYLGLWSGESYERFYDPEIYNIEEVGTDLSAGHGYERQLITFDAPVNGVAANSNELAFGPDSYPWQGASDELWYIGLYDSLTGGELLMMGGVTGTPASKQTFDSTAVVVAVGLITVTFE